MTDDELGFSPTWFAAGVVTAESAADFARYAAADPARPPRSWRWAAFRDFVEEHTPLTAGQCEAVYRLGEAEPDAHLGTAIMAHAVYEPACPAGLLREAAGCDRPAVRRAAGRLGWAGRGPITP
jgi:hypothetical protein